MTPLDEELAAMRQRLAYEQRRHNRLVWVFWTGLFVIIACGLMLTLGR